MVYLGQNRKHFSVQYLFCVVMYRYQAKMLSRTNTGQKELVVFYDHHADVVTTNLFWRKLHFHINLKLLKQQ